MNKITNKTSRTVLFALAIAGVLTFASTYVPMLSQVAYACVGNGSGC